MKGLVSEIKQKHRATELKHVSHVYNFIVHCLFQNMFRAWLYNLYRFIRSRHKIFIITHEPKQTELELAVV